MQYLGGKSRIAKPIATYLASVRKADQCWVEPCCGGLWITQEIIGDRQASDANTALITLYTAIQKGWIPPEVISEEQYAEYKSEQNPKDPLTAFIGIGCSFAAKWFGGYARNKIGHNYALAAKRSLLKKMERCKDVVFFSADYREALFAAPKKSLVYFDPPYANTTGYAATGSFDSGQFWSVVRSVALEHDVYVSEYSAPPDFTCVFEIRTKTDMRTKDGTKEARTEKIFRWKGEA